MAEHMKQHERGQIEILLKRGFTIPQIARELNRPAMTITREIKCRRIDSNKGVKERNALCVHFADCTRRDVCHSNCGLRVRCRNCEACHLNCADFKARTCDRLFTPPFVCNGCESERVCILPKKFYVAVVAQANYDGMLHESRKGVHATAKQIEEMNKAVTDGISRKQSVRNIIASNVDTFLGRSQKTIYTYIESGLFDVVRGDLPYACMRRKPKKPAVTKTNAKCRVGRTYREYLAFLAANPGIRHVELDTVKGSISGKVLFTMVFECGLALAFLKDHETAQTCTGVFNMLERVAGPALFRRLFPVILTDNGSCFSNPDMIENARAENNPYKLIPRTKVFYCDAYCSSQKPHVERFHVELRRILTKGTSFNALSQADVNVILSNLNSYTRGILDDSTPYDEFVKAYGDGAKEFLAKLGIERIPSNQVTLDPILLGKRFKRHADKIILKKNGVEKQ